MSRIYLSKEDLEHILGFLNDFQADVVGLDYKSESGIGYTLSGTILNQEINGHIVSVTRDIVDETGW